MVGLLQPISSLNLCSLSRARSAALALRGCQRAPTVAAPKYNNPAESYPSNSAAAQQLCAHTKKTRAVLARTQRPRNQKAQECVRVHAFFQGKRDEGRRGGDDAAFAAMG